MFCYTWRPTIPPVTATLSSPAVQSRGFVLHLVRSGGELHFQPTAAEFEEQLLAVFERIIAAVQKLKRAETRVFLDWPGRAQYLKVRGRRAWLDDDIVILMHDVLSLTLLKRLNVSLYSV